MKRIYKKLITASFAGLVSLQTAAQVNQTEDYYYPMATIPAPEGVELEVGGIATLPDGSVAVSVRRGDVWIIENPYGEDGLDPQFRLFAEGLHEPLGLAYRDESLYVAQRGELTRLADKTGDGRADVYETVYAWPLSAHYHEYSFGPKITSDGSMFVTGNVAFTNQTGEWWRGESRVPWRGWTMKISPDGKMEPWATGMRSPAGLGLIDDELFYTDNQGDWIGSGAIWHVSKGAFTGHPAGLRWTSEPNSPVKLTSEEFFSQLDERRIKKNGRPVKPKNIENEKNPDIMYNIKKKFPELTLPAVWLPHGIMGVSNSELVVDNSDGQFGPFAGQAFVGDQGQSKVMRVVMEKVKGEYQGAAFDFRKDFQSGVLRLGWGKDGSLFAGETNRGWGSAGSKNSGLQRLIWSGKVPMEMATVRAKPDGFELEFTKPVDRKSAEDLSSYAGKSYVYKYHSVYGSPPIKTQSLNIKGVKVSRDGRTVRLLIDNLQQYHVHEIHVPGIRAKGSDLPVLHPVAYYTLNNIPGGSKLRMSQVSTKRSKPEGDSILASGGANVDSPDSPDAGEKFAEVPSLLAKNTCTACHSANKKQVGPAFAEIAKRKYSADRIAQLIANPEPSNWPDFSTPMPPMPQVSKQEAKKIADWINSL
jgi:cytochrome c551/c552